MTKKRIGVGWIEFPSIPDMLTFNGDIMGFDIDKWLPPGNIMSWSYELWTTVMNAQDLLPQQLYYEVECALEEKWRATTEDREAAPSVEDKSIADMTDEEWMKYDDALADDATSYTALPIDDTPVLPPSVCTCDGPGSGAKKEYSSHTIDCPVVAVCNCDGLGSATAKWPAHMFGCPADPPASKPMGQGHGAWKKPLCKHDRSPFALDGGLSIFASAYRDIEHLDNENVDVGVYLYSSWRREITTTPGLAVPWAEETMTEGVYIDWPDCKAPSKKVPMQGVVAWMLESISQGVKMETACMGGHGRTGTMLALLLVAQGVIPPVAVDRVRDTHCKEAIESREQVEYIAAFYEACHGNKAWRQSKPARKRFDKLLGYSGSKKGGSKLQTAVYATPPEGGWTKENPSPSGYYTGAKWDQKTGGYL